MDALTQKTLERAHRASLKDGRVRYVVPTAYGPRIAMTRIPWTRCLWTNNAEAGYWEPGEQRGTVAMSWNAEQQT